MRENRELSEYLITVATVFNKNGPNIIENKQFNDYITTDNTNPSIINVVNTFVGNLNDNQQNKAFNSIDYLNQIVVLLIKKITGNDDEPIWSIIQDGNKYYFIPSKEAVEKYDINVNYGFLTNQFEIPPPPQSQSIFKRLFRGGKKSKKRRPKRKNNTKMRNR